MKRCALGVVLLMLLLKGSMAAAADATPGEVHFQRAMQYEFDQNIDAAIAEYRRGLELDPDSVQGHANYGLLLLNERGDVDGAISEFVTALGIDPASSFCQLHLNE